MFDLEPIVLLDPQAKKRWRSETSWVPNKFWSRDQPLPNYSPPAAFHASDEVCDTQTLAGQVLAALAKQGMARMARIQCRARELRPQKRRKLPVGHGSCAR